MIQSCFKTFMGQIEFKFVLFLFYATPLFVPNIFPYQHFILIGKLHSQIIFCMVATLMEHLRIRKIHKNFLGDIPNLFPYQDFIPSLRNCIHNGTA